MIIFILAAIIGYLLGSISFAVIISRMRGVDIFKAGSGSPGATNVKRVLGKKAGNTVFVLDFLKGLVATGWPLFFLNDNPFVFYLALTGLITSVLGHTFSIFLKFRGGKGIATTMGGTLILMPLAFVIGVALWGLTFFATRYVSLASIIFGISLPISTFILNEPRELVIVSGILALLILIRHHSNIRRLIKGNESKFTKPPKSL